MAQEACRRDPGANSREASKWRQVRVQFCWREPRAAVKQTRNWYSCRAPFACARDTFGTPMIADREVWDLTINKDQKVEHHVLRRARHVARS
ncbi:hypothetical protein KFL_005000050 [Klebsormidium nitens]|uniref:Uncharacterized protein n=1 Tax=Klebsormidium nitens TaxID=105231 RepID=A0A1Y1IM84_KLENI|nr:hypothetical protein KFL_005000050 [Klebsormidium nitens]|eukprot:GAQ89228.1 hypothetical protein KFL_005000050 [Klebsormidium nitens]